MSKINEFLHANQPAECEIEYDTIKMPCPNCYSFALVKKSDTDVSCMDCGQDFILIGRSTLRFK